MRKRVFFKNAVILTVTSLILRTIGIFFRIYVSNRVGGEGMGLYQLIVSVYVLVSSFAAAGLNTAVTRLCTDELAIGSVRSAKRILYLSMGVSLVVGCFSALVVIGGADTIATVWLHDSRAASSLKILTIGLPFMGISSCIKGYFLARRKVTSSSLSQIAEQIVRIFSITMILSMMQDPNIEHACFAVLLGDTIAEITSCGYMAISYLLDKRHLSCKETDRFHPKPRHRLRSILHIAVPITAGRYLSSGLRTAENILIPETITQFTGVREIALSQFGKLKGMALPLIFFPSSFLNAFSALLIPEISEANALSNRRQMQRTVRKTLQLTLLSSVLIGAVFFVLAEPLGMLVYHDSEVGTMMKFLSLLAPVMYLESVVVGLLKGLDQQSHSLLYSVLDSLSRIILILWLLPSGGIHGLFVVMVISNFLTCGLNTRRLCKVSGVKIRWRRWIVYPSLAAAVAVILLHVLSTTALITSSDSIFYCGIAGGLTITVYVLLIRVFHCLTAQDLQIILPIHRQKESS